MKIIQEDIFWNYFFFKVIKKLNQYLKKKKKRLNLILNDFNDN